MKEHPIAFSDPMVRAERAGLKTQTRRAIKGFGHAHEIVLRDRRWLARGDRPTNYGGEVQMNEWEQPVRCPYGVPGDRLWVREAYSGPHWMTGVPPREWLPGTPIWYWADGEPRHGDWTKPKPPMHLPRIFSRTLLEVTEIRVERLQEISEADAITEGCIDSASVATLQARRNRLAAPDVIGVDGKVYQDARHAYRALWEQINGPGSWDANPWVWVVSFKRAEAAC